MNSDRSLLDSITKSLFSKEKKMSTCCRSTFGHVYIVKRKRIAKNKNRRYVLFYIMWELKAKYNRKRNNNGWESKNSLWKSENIMCQVCSATQMRHFGLALGAKLKTQGVQTENNMD